MANEPLALAMAPDAPSEDEYQAFLLALSESTRGRAFLAEHARRSRSEDSAMLLSSVQRLEGLVRGQTDAPAENPIDEVRAMLEDIRGVQAELDVNALAMQVAKLAELIEGVQQRIDSLAVPAPSEAPPPGDAAALAEEPVAAEEAVFAVPEPEPVAAEDAEAEAVPDVLAEPEALVEAETLAETVAEAEADVAPEAEMAIEAAFEVAPEVEPAPEAEPEFAAAVAEPASEPEAESAALAPLEAMPEQDAAMEAVAEAAEEAEPDAEATFAIPEVAWCGGDAVADEEPISAVPAPAAGLAIAALVETLIVPAADEPPAPEVKVIKAGTIPPPPPFAGEDFSAGKRARAVPPPVDPLADIKALSEDERVALFT